MLLDRLEFLIPLIALSWFSVSCVDTPPPCQSGFIGDPAAAPELIPAALRDDHLVPLQDGDDIDLLRPIQGGHVLFTGALVRNVDGCGGSIRGDLRQLGQAGKPGPIIVYDERSTDLQADLANVANVPACPDVEPYDIVDATLWLGVTYTERGGRSTSALTRIVPRCQQTNDQERALCRCECLANYTIGRCSGGLGPGTDAGTH